MPTDYISLISKCSNRYGDKLLELLDWCGVTGLYQVTQEKAKKFYEKRCKTHAIAGQR